MGNIEYAKIFNSLVRFFKPSSIKAMQKKYVFSMARLGHLIDLKDGDLNSYYQGNEEVGKIDLPHDFFNLNSVPNLMVEVWYYGNATSNGRDHAFELRLYGSEVPWITILYGAMSGIKEVIVHGYKCKPPEGFSLASFAVVLREDMLKSFVLRYGHLSRNDIQRINKWGL